MSIHPHVPHPHHVAGWVALICACYVVAVVVSAFREGLL